MDQSIYLCFGAANERCAFVGLTSTVYYELKATETSSIHCVINTSRRPATIDDGI